MTRKIFINSFLLGLSVLVLCLALFFGMRYTQTIEEGYDRLKGEAEYARSGLQMGGLDYLKSLGNTNHITWLDAEGKVLYDNYNQDLSQSYSEREEFKSARQTGEGKGIMKDDSGSESVMSYAVLCADGTVLRLSSHLSVISNVLKAVSPIMWVFSLVLIISGIIAFRMANQILKPVNGIDPDNPDLSDEYTELKPLIERLQEQKLTIQDQIDELSYRQKEFAALTEGMEEGFLIADKRGVILSANGAALRHTRACKIGEELKFIDDGFTKAKEQALSGEKTEQLIEIDGRNYRLITTPVVSHKRVSGAVFIIMDVTEKEQRDMLRREFSANVSKELTGPVEIIAEASSKMCKKKTTPEEARKYAEDINKESKRLMALLGDIIRLSKLDNGEITEKKEKVDVYKLSETVIKELKEQAEEKEVALKIEGETAYVNGVEQVLKEMFFNLLENAIKYNRKGGEAVISIKEKNEHVTVTVKDTGIGIPYGDQSRVFERFFRVDKTHSNSLGGTGLGLSIVKHGAQFHDADVNLYSVPGEGTQISIRF